MGGFFVSFYKLSELNTNIGKKREQIIIIFFCELSFSRDEQRRERKKMRSSVGQSIMFCFLEDSCHSLSFSILFIRIQFFFYSLFFFFLPSSDPWKRLRYVYIFFFFLWTIFIITQLNR